MHEHKHACIHDRMSLHGCVVAMHAWLFNESPFASPLPNICSFHPPHPPRSPLTSTRAQHPVPPPTFPTSHTPKRSIRPSTLHSNPPLGLPLKLTPKILLHTISVCPPGFASPVTLPSHQPSTTRARTKTSTETASCCEAGGRHEANGFLGRPRRLQDLFSTTESLQVARHPLAHDWFQLASKFDSAKPQHKNF